MPSSSCDVSWFERSRRPLLLLAAGVFAISLSACGRRGPLQPPPDPQTQAEAAAKAARTKAQADKKAGKTGNAGQSSPQSSETTRQDTLAAEGNDEDNEALTVAPFGQAAKRPSKSMIPNTPFILDPLL